MNIANDLRAASGPETNIPTKENDTPDSTAVLPVSATSVAASAVPCSTNVDEVSMKSDYVSFILYGIIILAIKLMHHNGQNSRIYCLQTNKSKS